MLNLNRYLYIIILLCFFLPFTEGCNFLDINAEEKALQENAHRENLIPNDTGDPESINVNAEKISQESGTVNVGGSLKKILSAIFLPRGDFSGFYLVIIGTTSPEGWLSLVPAFIILIILIFMTGKKDVSDFKRVFYFSLALNVFLILFLALYFKELMYGFWLALFLSLFNTVTAGMIMRKIN
jgi:hypothetical protein